MIKRLFLFLSFFTLLLTSALAETVTTTITITNARQTSYKKDEVTGNDLILLEGSVQLSVQNGSSTSEIKADKITYDRKTEILYAEGNVEITTKSSSSGAETTSASSLLLNTATLEGVFDGGRVVKTQTDAINLPSGSTLIVFSDLFANNQTNTITFKNSSLTFCDEEIPHWHIDASRTWLLPGGEFAFFNALLYVGSVPVFYFPAFYYPKDELVFNPVFTYRTREGYSFQTTTYLYGRKPLYLGTDDYFISRDKIPFGPDGRQNFEDLDAIDVDLFNRQLNDLLRGKKADLPRFDFQSGEPVFGERIVDIAPDQPIVIEGIHALNEALTPQIDPKDKYKIYISPLSVLQKDKYRRIPLTDIRKLRRIVRDAKKRGWNAKHTIDGWASVRAGEDKNIFPYSDNADAIFNSTLVYELAALKSAATPMLEEIAEDDPCYTEAQRLLRLLSDVRGIDEYEYIIPNNSIIREFIGGSVIA